MTGIISQYNADRQTVLDEFDLETAIPYWASHGYITTGASGGDMDPEELAEFLNNLYKSSVKRIKSAKKAYNDGDFVKAAKDITIGTAGLTMGGSILFIVILYETYGPIYQQKQELNKTS